MPQYIRLILSYDLSQPGKSVRDIHDGLTHIAHTLDAERIDERDASGNTRQNTHIDLIGAPEPLIEVVFRKMLNLRQSTVWYIRQDDLPMVNARIRDARPVDLLLAHLPTARQRERFADRSPLTYDSWAMTANAVVLLSFRQPITRDDMQTALNTYAKRLAHATGIPVTWKLSHDLSSS